MSAQSLLGEESRSVSASPIGLYSSGILPNNNNNNSNNSNNSNSNSTNNSTSLVFSGIGNNSNTSLGFTGPTGGGKPQNIRRGPGRPRKEFLLKSQKPTAPRDNRVVKRIRGGAAMRGMYTKRKATQWIGNMSTIGQLQNTTETNFLSNMMMPSPLNDDGSNSLTPTNSLDQDTLTASFSSAGSEKLMQPPEEPPYFPEKWPGKVCALCCLGERSQLGQGEMLRIEAKDSDAKLTSISTALELAQTGQGEDKSSRNLAAPQLSNRRQKGLNKCK